MGRWRRPLQSSSSSRVPRILPLPSVWLVCGTPCHRGCGTEADLQPRWQRGSSAVSQAARSALARPPEAIDRAGWCLLGERRGAGESRPHSPGSLIKQINSAPLPKRQQTMRLGDGPLPGSIAPHQCRFLLRGEEGGTVGFRPASICNLISVWQLPPCD